MLERNSIVLREAEMFQGKKMHLKNFLIKEMMV